MPIESTIPIFVSERVLYMEKSQNRAFLPTLLSCSIFAGIGLSLTLGAVFFAAVLVSKGRIDGTGLPLFCAAASGIGALSAGFLSARKIRRRAAVTGLIAGTIFLSLLVILGAVFFPQLSLGAGFSRPCIAVLTGSLAGGILSAVGR